MIQIVCGEKGRGKTKILLEKAHEAAKTSNGDVVYLDKSHRQMFELDNRVRLINVTEYPVDSFSGFTGFIAGLLSGNHDIDTILADSFLKISHLGTKEALEEAMPLLEKLSDGINFILSISVNENDIPDSMKDKVIFP